MKIHLTILSKRNL